MGGQLFGSPCLASIPGIIHTVKQLSPSAMRSQMAVLPRRFFLCVKSWQKRLISMAIYNVVNSQTAILFCDIEIADSRRLDIEGRYA